MKQTGELNKVGRPDATILIVTDAPGKGAYELGQVMSKPQMELIKRLATEHGIPGASIRMVTPSPNIPEEIETSERKVGEFLALYREELLAEVHAHDSVQLVVTLGKTALRQLAGRPVKITEARGSMTAYDCVFNGQVPVLPLLSPAHALRRPEVLPVFESDFRQMATFRDSGWDEQVFEQSIESASYEWTYDLSALLKKRPRRISLDIETKGLSWQNGRKAILSVSLTTREGHAYVVPLDLDYINNDTLRGESTKHLPKLTGAGYDKLIAQLKELLGDPEIRVTGHNLKFDLHHLRNYGIEVANWFVDTMQLAFAVDDNMQVKSLDECTRRWVKEMAGYADAFNSDPIHEDKSRMDLVPHDQMLRYAGGDTDACFRLTEVLCKVCKEDSRQWRVFRAVMMPALKAFLEMEEAGIGVDKTELIALGATYDEKETHAYTELMEMAAKKAPAVLRKHADAGLRFSRDSFLIDLLFTEEGFGLTPRVFTPGTRKLPPDQRIPSVSTKEHLPFFDHIPFVRKLIDYQKLSKLRTTYIGTQGGVNLTRINRLKTGKFPKPVIDALLEAGAEFKEKVTPPVRRRIAIVEDPPEGFAVDAGRYALDHQGRCWRKEVMEPTGFWQYLTEGWRLHPTFRLDQTVTGRTSSQNPNAQNFPKRGPSAKDFRKIFVPEPGWVLIEADLSQAELRIAAWMANEPNMLRIYQEGGDIHAATASGVVGIALPQIMEGMDDKTLLAGCVGHWKGAAHYLAGLGAAKQATATVKDYVKQLRQQAKAVNFGFLYGMWWKKFMDYAKTDYGVTFTPKQAEAIRSRFFAMYPGLESWHKEMRKFVNANGYVRALHGALRRLPSIHSSEEGIRQEVERQSINSPVQRFASDLGVMAMSRFTRDCPKDIARPVAFIHDANVVEARVEHAAEVAGALKFYMQSNPLELFDLHPPLPILSDVSIGYSLADMEERPEIPALAPAWHRPELEMRLAL